jgi:MFS transporter, DHA1 family, inner membrane transport protein
MNTRPVAVTHSGPATSQPARLDSRIFLLAFAIFATGTDAGVVAGMLPQIAQDFDLGIGTTGQLLTAYAITYAVGSPFFGVLSARYQSERVILVCLIAFALAVALSAVAPGIAVLLVARVLAACFSATYSPAAFAMAAALAPPDRRGAGLSALSTGFVATMVSSVPLGVWVAYHLGWRVTFGIDVLLVLLAAAALWFAGLPKTARPPSISLGARLRPLTRPKLLAALTAKTLWATAVNSISLFIAVLFGPRFGADGVVLLFAALGLGGLAGSQLGGRLVDRFGTTRSICYCLAGMILELALLNLMASSFHGTAIALFTLSCFAWALFPALQGFLLQLEPDHSIVVLSLNNSTSYAGLGTGALLGTLVIGAGQTSILPYISCAVAALALATWLITNRTHITGLSARSPSEERRSNQ